MDTTLVHKCSAFTQSDVWILIYARRKEKGLTCVSKSSLLLMHLSSLPGLKSLYQLLVHNFVYLIEGVH